MTTRKIKGVYLLYNNSRVVYVGQSKDVMTRIRTHLREEEKDFDAFSVIECEDDLEIESYLLHRHRAWYNIDRGFFDEDGHDKHEDTIFPEETTLRQDMELLVDKFIPLDVIVDAHGRHDEYFYLMVFSFGHIQNADRLCIKKIDGRWCINHTWLKDNEDWLVNETIKLCAAFHSWDGLEEAQQFILEVD